MRLLLADDHHVVREALAGFIRRAASDIVVTEASTTEQAAERVGSHGPFDLILLDYQMPGMNGLAGFDQIRGLVPRTPIAILSGHIGTAESAAALDRGAAGILLKELHGTSLLSALREMAAGKIFVPGSLREAIQERQEGSEGDDVDRERRRLLGRLTPREMECLQLLMRGSTNQQIATALNLAEVTIKLHLHSTYKKMGARNRSDAVRIALLKGLSAL